MNTKDKTLHYGHDTFDKLASATGQVSDALSEKGDELRQAEQKLMRHSRKLVCHNPIASLGIAATAGFLLSCLISHRKDD